MVDQENKDLLNEEEVEEVIEDAVDNTQIFDSEEETVEEAVVEDVDDVTPSGPVPPKKDNRKVLIPIILAIIVILVVLIFVLLNQGGGQTPTPTSTPNPTPTTTTEVKDYSEDIALWDSNYEINNDYVGEIRFDSGIIDLPVVQYVDPDDPSIGLSKYLRTDWRTMEHDEEGSIFIDPVSDIETSQNITIYGHYVYPSYEPSMTHMFTPLVNFLEEDFYEENKYFEIIFENEVRRYEIAHVYYAEIDLNNPTDPLADGMYYMNPDWTAEELEYYLEQVSEVEFYDTGVEIGPDDKFVTLQTCVENRDDLREIVIAKQIDVIEIR